RRRVPQPRVFDPDSWLKIRGAPALPEVGRRALRAAFLWREGVARAADRAPFRVVRNEVLYSIAADVAERGPAALERLRATRGLPPSADAGALARAIRSALDGN